MAGYIRQSSFIDGDTITAALFNNEYNQLVNAFSNTSGHKHDGTTAEGPVIGLIGDAGETSPNNKVLIDTTNNYIEFYVEVSSAPVQQLYIADGAIIPVTDSDIDLGTTSLRFKDTYTDTITTTGNATIGGDLTVTGSATISGNLTFGDADTDSINLAAEIDSDIIPNTDGTYDLGSATKEWQDLYIDGTANIDSLVADTADINGGTIDGATIATSDITVGSGKTLDVSAGTLTLADDQISGDKVEGGTIAATTITTLTSTTGNITNVNATTLDTTNIEVTNLKAKDGTSAGSIADSTGVVTLASSVLTTTDINGGTIDGTTIATSDITVGTGKTLDVSSGTLTLADNQISGDKVEGGTIAATTITDLTFGSLNDGTITITAFADEDDMSSNSATLVPTQQSVKAYVDSQVTAQDLDFQGDTGGALSIDLDSESLTIAGGTGIDTSGATNTLTVAIDSTVATLTDTQTLTNKTLTTPVISSISNTGTLTLPTSTDTLVGRATTDTLTNKTLTTPIISSISNTGTLTLPTSTDTLVGRATTDTLTNKTLTSPVLNTGVSGTAILDEDNMASDSATQLATQQSIKAYVDTEVGAIVTDVVSDTTPQLGGDLDTNGNDILFADNDKAIFGAGSDFQIYHDGSNSYIHDVGTGNINIEGRNIFIVGANTDTNLAGFIDGAEARLYYNGSQKLATTSTGIDVTGTVTSDGLTVDGTATFNTGTGTTNNFIITGTDDGGTTAPDLILFRDSASPVDGDNIGMLLFKGNNDAGTAIGYAGIFATINDATSTSEDGKLNFSVATANTESPSGGTTFMTIEGGGDISFYDNTGTSQALYWDASAESLGIGTSSPAAPLHVATSSGDSVILVDNGTSQARFATDNDGPYIYALTSGDSALRVFGENLERLRIDTSGNVGIGGTSPGSYGKFVLFQNSNTNGGGISVIDSGLARTGRLWTDGNRVYLSSGATGLGDLVLNEGGGNVGIGETSPESNLHIKKAASGSSYSADGSDLVIIENSSSAAIDVRTPTGDSGGILFSDTTRARGAIIYYHSLDDMYFNVAGTSGAMVLDSSGNVGIGTTSPTDFGSGFKTLQITSANTTSGGVFRSTNSDSSTVTQLNTNETGGFVGTTTSHPLVLGTANTERMRIDSSGKVGVGDQASSPTGVLEVNDDGADPIFIVHKNSSGVSDAVQIRHGRGLSGFVGTGIDFQRADGTTVGTVVIGFTSTAYNTTSDYRLKENVNYTWDATTRLKQLKPARFNFIEETGTTVDGFLAHEVQDIVPQAVTGEKDAVDGDGNPKHQSIDHSKLVPLLVKTIQELEARITALES